MTEKMDLLFRILMSSTNHLREINNDRFPIFPFDKNIEFVEITMDQTSMSKFEDEGHEFRVEVGWIRYFIYLTTRLSALSASGDK